MLIGFHLFFSNNCRLLDGENDWQFNYNFTLRCIVRRLIVLAKYCEVYSSKDIAGDLKPIEIFANVYKRMGLCDDDIVLLAFIMEAIYGIRGISKRVFLYKIILYTIILVTIYCSKTMQRDTTEFCKKHNNLKNVEEKKIDTDIYRMILTYSKDVIPRYTIKTGSSEKRNHLFRGNTFFLWICLLFGTLLVHLFYEIFLYILSIHYSKHLSYSPPTEYNVFVI